MTQNYIYSPHLHAFMATHAVADKGDIDEGERIVIELEGKEVGVFNVDGEYVAYLNWCLHQNGPCCEGRTSGTTDASWDRESLEKTLTYVREDEILNCPWHGWEYDLKNGECLAQSDLALPSFPVNIENGKIKVTL